MRARAVQYSQFHARNFHEEGAVSGLDGSARVSMDRHVQCKALVLNLEFVDHRSGVHPRQRNLSQGRRMGVNINITIEDSKRDSQGITDFERIV